jgi:hypothetical protein
MARKIKIDNAELKRFAQQEKKRKIGGTPQRKFFLIVCEGAKTEPNYFESIKNRIPRGIIKLDIQGEGKNTLTLIEETIKIRSKSLTNYDETWAVFDKDSFPDQNFNNAINKAEKNKINCAWTNEAFELWYLLHLEFINVAMNREDYKPRIENWITQKSEKPFKYQKNSNLMYQILQEFGDENQAISWAEQLEQNYDGNEFAKHNPCTKVHNLIKNLNGFIKT